MVETTNHFAPEIQWTMNITCLSAWCFSYPPETHESQGSGQCDLKVVLGAPKFDEKKLRTVERFDFQKNMLATLLKSNVKSLFTVSLVSQHTLW